MLRNIVTRDEAKITELFGFGKALVVAKFSGRLGDLLSYRAELERLLSNRLLIWLVSANEGITADLRSYALRCLLVLLRIHIKHDV